MTFLMREDVVGRYVGATASQVRHILEVAEDMNGDQQKAVIWFERHPVPGWAGKTARQLVDEGKGDAILAYLQASRSGVYS